LDPEDAEGRNMLKRVASSLYGGGTDTDVDAISSFVLLMSLHPEAPIETHPGPEKRKGYIMWK